MRVLLHYTHKQTLGHTTRSASLAAALCRRGAEILVLQGGVHQPFIHFPNDCRVMDIPFPFDTRASFEAHAIPTSAGKRAQFILRAAAEFKPDVFVTEFFPFGRLAYMPELLPTLRYLRKKGTRLVSSVGYPLLIDLDRLEDKTFAALHKAVFALYDMFLVHTPDQLETPYIKETIRSPLLASSYAAILENLKKKIIYTGYVFPEPIMTGGTALTKTKTPSKTIVVSRGGGAVYSKIITTAIEAQRLINDQITTIIACGPATTSDEMAQFESCLTDSDKKRVILASHVDDLGEQLRHCQVSVSLCGYNTSVQLMRYGTPSVVVPYQNTHSKTSTNDQIARAKLLQEKFSNIVLDYNTLTAHSLTDAIQKQISRPRPKPAPADWFNGAEVAARLLAGDKPD